MDLGNIYQSLDFLNTRVMKTDFHNSLYAFLLHFLVTFAIMRFLCVDVDGSATFYHTVVHSYLLIGKLDMCTKFFQYIVLGVEPIEGKIVEKYCIPFSN